MVRGKGFGFENGEFLIFSRYRIDRLSLGWMI